MMASNRPDHLDWAINDRYVNFKLNYIFIKVSSYYLIYSSYLSSYSSSYLFLKIFIK